jgi:putative SOS response-associated peptidase YedK
MPLGFEVRNALEALWVRSMCNLYSITKNQAAIRDLFKVARDSAGNLPPMPGVFPDYPAPVVRNAGGDRELTMMRWGMPPAAEVWRTARYQRPQHVIPALAGLAETGEPMPRAGDKLFRVCA